MELLEHTTDLDSMFVYKRSAQPFQSRMSAFMHQQSRDHGVRPFEHVHFVQCDGPRYYPERCVVPHKDVSNIAPQALKASAIDSLEKLESRCHAAEDSLVRFSQNLEAFDCSLASDRNENAFNRICDRKDEKPYARQ